MSFLVTVYYPGRGQDVTPMIGDFNEAFSLIVEANEVKHGF